MTMGYVVWPHSPTGDAVRDVYDERLRQDRLKAEGRFPFTCADSGLSVTQKLAVLAEEFGEAARAVMEMDRLCNDRHGVDLRKELIQIAAVCVAWIESLPVMVGRCPRCGSLLGDECRC